MSENNRSELIDHAKLCYKLKRWEDTIDCLKKVLKMDTPLNYEERELLCSAQCEKPSSLIQTWGSLQNHSKDNILVKNLIEKIEQEITEYCDNAIEFLDDDSIKKDKHVDAIVHYKSNKAGFCHYKIPFMSGKNRDDEIRKCRELLEESMTIAKESLKASHPVRIWTALQFSNFQRNICKCVDEAHVVARQAYNEGISGLSDLDSSLHEDATKYLKKLRALIEKELS